MTGFILILLSFVAENERNNIRIRQAEGIAAAKARGVKFGAKELPLTDEFWKAYEMYHDNLITADDAAKMCGVSRATFYRRLHRLNYNFENE